MKKKVKQNTDFHVVLGKELKKYDIISEVH